MSKLFELLAVERTRTTAANKLLDDTANKFKKDQFFSGHIKTLKMLVDSPENSAIEEAARDEKELPTTVPETLEYALDFWAKAEDVTFAKNLTNQRANADLLFRGAVLVPNVPVDELLGLETRLEVLRRTLDLMPTLDASKEWTLSNSGRKGEFVTTNEEVTSKTEKTMTPVVLYEATDKHPAQIERVTVDKVVGTFKRKSISGAATSRQKANVIAVLDELLVEAKQARQRANSVEASTDKIGSIITNLILDAFKYV
jgi:hypothetical protein